MDLEDEEEDRKAAEREEQRRREQEDPRKDAYVERDGKVYDPKKKFGIIDDQSLIYDNITSSYPLNLPTQYYQDHVRRNLPKKEDGEWYIRPHHVESLTEHTSSMKDNVLNTRYFSHYNQQYGKKVKTDERAVAINHIEGVLSKLKS